MGKSMKYARAGLQFHALHIDSDKLTPPCLCLRSVINRPLFSIQKKVITLSFFFGLEMFIFLINFLHLFNKKVHKLRLDFRVFFNTFLSLIEKLFSEWKFNYGKEGLRRWSCLLQDGDSVHAVYPSQDTGDGKKLHCIGYKSISWYFSYFLCCHALQKLKVIHNRSGSTFFINHIFYRTNFSVFFV